MGWLKKIFQVFLVVGVAALASIPFKRLPPQPAALQRTAPDTKALVSQPPLQLQHSPSDDAQAASTVRPLPTEDPPPVEKTARAEVRAASKIPSDPPRPERISSGSPPPAFDPKYEPIGGATSTPGGASYSPSSGSSSGGVKPITDQDSTPSASGSAEFSPQRHVVADGDTLETLAERYLGNRERAGDIRQANRDRLADGDALRVGTELRIP